MLNHMHRTTVIKNMPPVDYEVDDPNDVWLLALADKTQAHYLVTGDKRAGILSRVSFGKTQLVTASVFCDKVL